MPAIGELIVMKLYTNQQNKISNRYAKSSHDRTILHRLFKKLKTLRGKESGKEPTTATGNMRTN